MARSKRKPLNAAKKANGKVHRRVKSLLKYLRAYGRGAEGNKLRSQFAKRCGSKIEYLNHIGYGYRTASVMMAAAIERNTHGLVTVEEMRPDLDWATLRRSNSGGSHDAARA